MTIDEAIKFCEEKSKNIKMKAEPQVFIQLAEWLEELKAIKSDGFTDNLLDMGYTKGYRKAIDDFAEKSTRIVYETNDRDRNPQPRDIVADIHYKLVELAEQLKAGGLNG